MNHLNIPYNDDPNDEALRHRLENHASEVSDDVFEKIAERRSDAALRTRLNSFESDVSSGLFNTILGDKILKGQLNPSESAVPSDLFDSLLNRRADRDLRERLLDFKSAVPNNFFDNLQQRREDNSVSDRLADYNSPVKPYVFDKITDELDNRRRRRLVYIRWAAAAAILLFIGSAFWLLETQKQEDLTQKTNNSSNSDLPKASNTEGGKKSENTISGSVNDDLNEVFQDKNLSNSAIKDRQKASNTEGGKKSENTVSNGANTDLSAVNQDKNTQNVGDKANLGAIFSQKQDKSRTKQLAQNPIAINNSAVDNTSKTEVITGKGKSQSVSLDFQNTISQPTNSIATQTFKSNPQEGANSEASVLQVLENQLVKTPVVSFSEVENTPPQYRHPVAEVTQLPTNWAVLNLNLEKKNPFPKKPGNKCPTFKTPDFGSNFGRPTINLEVHFAPEYAIRHWELNTVEAEKLLRYRDTMEQPWFSTSLGMRAAFVFENGLSIRVGGRFNQHNEIAQRDSIGVGQIKTLIDSTKNPDGTWLVSTRREVISGVFRTRRYNRYRSIDLPVEVGYQVPIGEFWTLSGHVGANVNLSAWRKAHVADENGVLQPIFSGSPVEKHIFSNVLGVSVLGSVAIYRYFGNGIHVFVEPTVRHSLKPITRPDYPLRQSYTNVGLNMGLRLQFGSY
jgi:hypothetical protein